MKEIKTQKFWTFELGTQEGIKVPIWNTVGFQQRHRRDRQNSNIDTFYRFPVTSAQCIIKTEKTPVSAILLSYNDNDCSQIYGQIKEAFKALTNDDILKPYISDHVYRSSKEDIDVC